MKEEETLNDKIKSEIEKIDNNPNMELIFELNPDIKKEYDLAKKNLKEILKLEIDEK